MYYPSYKVLIFITYEFELEYVGVIMRLCTTYETHAIIVCTISLLIRILFVFGKQINET